MSNFQMTSDRRRESNRGLLKLSIQRSVQNVVNREPARMKNFFCIVICSAVVTLGCASNEGILGVDKLADIPAGTLPKPHGTYVCEWNTTQAMQAAIDRQVFYRADFVGDSAAIAPSALRQFSEQLQYADVSEPIRVILEPSGDGLLDRQRSDALITTAAELGFGGNVDLQIAHPAALGLLGGEAERLGNSVDGAGRAGQNNGARGGGSGNAGGLGGGFSRAGGIF